MATPTWTVVIPTVDRPQLARRAAESVLAQTATDLEVVVVNNGPCRPLELPCDPRLRLITRPGLLGAAGARNLGARAGSGRLIAFLDDDDVFLPDRLANARSGHERASVVCCWSRFAGEDDSAVSRRYLEGDVADRILDGLTPYLGATSVERSRLLPFDESWRAVEDIDWWLRAAADNSVTTVEAIDVVIHRHDGERFGNDLAARLDEGERLLDAHRRYFSRHPRARAFRLYRMGVMARQLGSTGTSARFLARSLAARPTLPPVRSLAGLAADAVPGPKAPR